MKDLLKAFGWEGIPSKNPYVESYKKDEYRFFTTGTVTIQSNGESFGPIVRKKIMNEEQMEEVISLVS